MIDNFSILLSHGWLILAFWMLTRNDLLDREPPPPLDAETEGFGKQRKRHGKPRKVPGKTGDA